MDNLSEKSSITLKKYQLSPDSFYWDKTACAFPFKVEAAEGTGALQDNNIFIMQLSGTGYDPNQGDMFVRIANALDIQELPDEKTIENIKTDDLQIPFYRTNKVTLFFETVQDCELFWNTCKYDVQNLVNTLNLTQNLETLEDESIITDNFDIETSTY